MTGTDTVLTGLTAWRNRIIETRIVTAAELATNSSNFRRHPEPQAKAVRGLLNEVGIVAPLIAYASERAGGALTLIDGHLRHEIGGEWPVTILDVSDQEADLILVSYDAITGQATIDPQALMALLGRIEMTPLEDDGLLALLGQMGTEASKAADESNEAANDNDETAARATLAERFLIPPFSVLDARQGYWQERKRAWIALGIQSELGRGENALDMSATMAGITDEDERAAWNTQRRESPKHGGGKDMAMHDSANFPTPLASKRSYDRKAAAND